VTELPPLIATREGLRRFPGVYPLGSEDERQLLECQVEGEIKLGGEAIEMGLLEPVLDPFWSATIQTTHLDQEAFCAARDWHALAEVDFRLRWCRWRLDVDGLPWDRGRICVLEFSADDGLVWAYAGDLEPDEHTGPGEDPLDFVQTLGIWHQPPWYAGKVLAHDRRAVILTERAIAGLGVNALGIAREWMLFGETWTEAKFMHEAPATVTGKKVRRGFANGRGRPANAERIADAKRRYEAIRAAAAGSPLRGEALERSVKRELARAGLDIPSSRTSRRALGKPD
jgi:hypothetical protein